MPSADGSLATDSSLHPPPPEPRTSARNSGEAPALNASVSSFEGRLSNIRTKIDFAEQIVRRLGTASLHPLVTPEERRREMVQVETAKLLHLVARHYNVREEMEELTGRAMDEKDALMFYRRAPFADAARWRSAEDPPNLTLDELRRESARLQAKVQAEKDEIARDGSRRRSAVAAHRVRSNLNDFLWLVESLELDLSPRYAEGEEELPLPIFGQKQEKVQPQQRRSVQVTHSAGDSRRVSLAGKVEVMEEAKESSGQRHGMDARASKSWSALSMSGAGDNVVDFSVEEDSLDSCDARAAEKLKLLKFMYEAIQNGDDYVEEKTDDGDKEEEGDDKTASSTMTKSKSSVKKQSARFGSAASRNSPFVTQNTVEENSVAEELEDVKSSDSQHFSPVLDFAPPVNTWTRREFVPAPPEVKVQPVPSELYDALRKLYNEFDYDNYFKHYYDAERHGGVHKSEAEQIASTQEKLAQQKREREEARLKKKALEMDNENFSRMMSIHSFSGTGCSSQQSLEASGGSQQLRDSAFADSTSKLKAPSSPPARSLSFGSNAASLKLDEETIVVFRKNSRVSLRLRGKKIKDVASNQEGKTPKSKRRRKGKEHHNKAAHKRGTLAPDQKDSLAGSVSTTYYSQVEPLCGSYENITLDITNDGNDTLHEVLNIDKKKLDNTKIHPFMEISSNNNIFMTVPPKATKSIMLIKPILKKHDMRFLDALSVGVDPNRSDLSNFSDARFCEEIIQGTPVVKPNSASISGPPLRRAGTVAQVPSLLLDSHGKVSPATDINTVDDEHSSVLDSQKGLGTPTPSLPSATKPGSADALPESGRSSSSKKRVLTPLPPSLVSDKSLQRPDSSSRVKVASPGPDDDHGDAGNAQREPRRGSKTGKEALWRTQKKKTAEGDQTDVHSLTADDDAEPKEGSRDSKTLASGESGPPSSTTNRKEEGTNVVERKSTLRENKDSSSLDFKATGEGSSAKRSSQISEQAPSKDDTGEMALETRPVDEWGVPLENTEEEAFEKNCVALSALQAAAWAGESKEAQLAAGESSGGKVISGEAEKLSNASALPSSKQSITSSAVNKNATHPAGAAAAALDADLENKMKDDNAEEAVVNAALEALSSEHTQPYSPERFGKLTSAEEVVSSFLTRIALEEGAEAGLPERFTPETEEFNRNALSIQTPEGLSPEPYETHQSDLRSENSVQRQQQESDLLGPLPRDGLHSPDPDKDTGESLTKEKISKSGKHLLGMEQAGMSLPFEGYDASLLEHSRRAQKKGKKVVSGTVVEQEDMQVTKTPSAGLHSASSGRHSLTKDSAPRQGSLGSKDDATSLHAEGEKVLARESSRHSSLQQRVEEALATRKSAATSASSLKRSPRVGRDWTSPRAAKPTPKVRRKVMRLPDSPTGEMPGFPTDQKIYKAQRPGGGVALFLPENVSSDPILKPSGEKVGGRRALLGKTGGEKSDKIKSTGEKDGSDDDAVRRQDSSSGARRPTALQDLSSALHGYARLASGQSGNVSRRRSVAEKNFPEAARPGTLPPIRSSLHASFPVYDVDDLGVAEGEARALFLQDPVRYDCVIDDIIQSATNKVEEDMRAEREFTMGRVSKALADGKRPSSSRLRRAKEAKGGDQMSVVGRASIHTEFLGTEESQHLPPSGFRPSVRPSTCVEIVTVASDLSQILDEQMRAKKIIAYVLTEMRRMWKRREMEANAAFRLAVQRYVNRSLLFAWRFERRRVLNLQKLISLLDRRTGRVNGWVPFYTKDSLVIDRFVWERSPPQLSRPLCVVRKAMCLARQQRLLPLRFVRMHGGKNRWEHNGNSHLLLGYRRAIVDPFQTTATRLRLQRRARFAAPFQRPSKRFTPKTLYEMGTPYL